MCINNKKDCISTKVGLVMCQTHFQDAKKSEHTSFQRKNPEWVKKITQQKCSSKGKKRTDLVRGRKILLIKHTACNLINWLLKKKIVFIAKYYLYGNIKLILLPWNDRENFILYTLHFYLKLPKSTGIAKNERDLTLKLIIWTRLSACEGAKDPLHPPTLIRVCLFFWRKENTRF